MRPNPPSTRIRFADFEIDLESRELFRAGHRVELQDKPFEVLVALVERPFRIVTRDELRDRLWSDQIVEFDNNLNTALTKVRRALDDTSSEPRWIETVPKRGYRWIGEVESKVPRRLSPRSLTAGAAAIALAALALIAVLGLLAVYGRSDQDGGTGVDDPRGAGESRASARSLLVVLPFVSSGSDDDELADAWTEELITRLAERLPREIGVIARTSSMRYKDRSFDLGELDQELGAHYALEGSLEGREGGLRITARLVGVGDQALLWASTFEEQVDELPRVQEAVAAGIARELGLLIESSARSPTTVSEKAWRAYLRARYLMQQPRGGRADRLESVISDLREAVELAPAFARGWSALAEALNRRRTVEGSWIESREAATRALELAPDLVEPRLRLAQIALYGEWDWETADRQLREASRIAPNLASIHHLRAGWFATQGRHREALAEIDRALVLDPLSVVLHADAGWYFFVARRYYEALARCAEALALEPDHRGANWYRLRSLLALKRKSDAALVARELLKIEGADAASVERARENPESALAQLFDLRRERLQADVDSGTASKALLAHAHLDLGDHSEALRLLVEGAETRGAWIYAFLAVYPPLDVLREQEAFQDLIARVGIPSLDPDPTSP